MVRKWLITYNLLINGVYWGYDLTTNLQPFSISNSADRFSVEDYDFERTEVEADSAPRSVGWRIRCHWMNFRLLGIEYLF